VAWVAAGARIRVCDLGQRPGACGELGHKREAPPQLLMTSRSALGNGCAECKRPGLWGLGRRAQLSKKAIASVAEARLFYVERCDAFESK